jgi:hypothetical protein
MTNYTLNFAQIELHGNTEVFVGRQSYNSNRLHELRREFHKTHIFQRLGAEDAIIDIPVVAGIAPVGNVQDHIDLTNMRGMWSPLFSAALLRAFQGQRDITSSWPVSVLGSVSRGLVQHSNLPKWLQKRARI